MPELAMLRRLVELCSGGLEHHEQRIGHYAFVLCHALNLDPAFGDAMRQACSFHDVGKLVLPDAILLKPTALTPDEWDVMCSHSQLGHEILRHGTGAIAKLAASIALTHHECFDGSGYPNGLRAYDIPLEGRIATVCDVYDALREDRVYRPGLTHEHAMDVMLNGDGRTEPAQFDPQMLQAFAGQSQLYAQMFDGHRGQLS